MLYDDTIAAIATPVGAGGIGIIRLSGPHARAILVRVFVPRRAGAWRPFRMRLGNVVTPDSAIVDEALAVYMRGPRSFTAEDVVEISCHGGPLIVQRVLALALAAGARAAEPGEFTLRAFINGRIDLAQAEATLDAINARTDAGLALAQAQLGGWLSGEVRRIRQVLLDPLAYITVLIDFPEDDVESQTVVPQIEAGLREIERLLATADQGIVYRQGARVALVGVPNVGKSSLLNALLRTDRAIVTPVPGTTRDTLEETANINGIPVVLVDTAGITDTNDLVERIGIERSRAALKSADLALLVLDATRPMTDAEREIATLTQGKPTLVVLNKADLFEEQGARSKEQGASNQEVAQSLFLSSSPPRIIASSHTVTLSAATGAGLDDLRAAISVALLGGALTSDAQLVSNPRHRDALERAAQAARDALQGITERRSPDLLVIDLHAALVALGEITGENVEDELLATIFSRFCIGK